MLKTISTVVLYIMELAPACWGLEPGYYSDESSLKEISEAWRLADRKLLFIKLDMLQEIISKRNRLKISPIGPMQGITSVNTYTRTQVKQALKKSLPKDLLVIDIKFSKEKDFEQVRLELMAFVNELGFKRVLITGSGKSPGDILVVEDIRN